jgi:hypothetical protein
MIPDDRLGFSTHFAQGQPLILIPMIAELGVGWIRDDGSWGAGEQVKGVYQLPPGDQVWIDAAVAAGLKVVWLLHDNHLYVGDVYNATAAANYCAWLAKAEETRLGPGRFAIEVVNEPNNVTEFKGHAGFTAYVALVNAVYAAVKAVSPTTPVLGCGYQGDEILACLAAGATVDGIAPHPYDAGDHVPEQCYEPKYTDFTAFIAALRLAAPRTAIWTTEQGCSDGSRTSSSEYPAAVWQARRLLLSLGEGVDHTFLYTFANTDTTKGPGCNFAQSTMSRYYNPQQSYFMLQRLIAALSGAATIHGRVTAIGARATIAADLYSEVFAVPGGRTIAALWLGNHAPSIESAPAAGTINVKFALNHSHYYRQASCLNIITGVSTPVIEPHDPNLNGWPQWNESGVITNVPVSDQPVLLLVP